MIRKLLQLLRTIIRGIISWAALPTPGRIVVQPISKEHGIMQYRVTFPAPGAADVVSRELTVENGGASVVDIYPVSQSTAEFTVPENVEVTLRLVEIDDATPTPNRSPERVQTFTATDTIAPPQPGEMAIELIGE